LFNGESGAVDMNTTSTVIIHEVGMRDGLQMEQQTVPMERKLSWIEALAAAGVDVIQVGSFVHPGKVPQMADTDMLFRELARVSFAPRPILSGLVLNEKGLERGLACGVEMFCMGVSASETHSRKNTGMSIAEATQRIIAIAKKAEEEKKRVQVSVQSAFGCGYEGVVPQERVLGLVQRFLDAGLRTISLADTAGHAMPDQVERMFGAVRALDAQADLACHFHNTYGLGLANAYAAMKEGVNSIESSVAGLGGCPFTKIAGGNVCTEDLVHMLQHMGLRPDISLERLTAVAQEVSTYFQHPMPGVIYRTGTIEAAVKP
jgi:hydroxymethylglutaryl-CoA lyase